MLKTHTYAGLHYNTVLTLVVLILLKLICHSICDNTSQDGMDFLSPYIQHHGAKHRRHRDTRDCQPVKYGNLTHSKVSAYFNSTGVFPLAESHYYIRKVGTYYWDQRVVLINHQIVHNPLSTLSVVEPGGPGGCDNTSDQRETVAETSSHKNCMLATNAGFFNTRTGECEGNVVSDGFLVRDNGGIQNAHFGITSDGYIYTGFLSELDLVYQSFTQLVGGVLWLVRDGERYVDQSAKVECPDTEETGPFERFISVISARTAVGHDAQGKVHLVQVNGKTDQAGMNLYEFADLLIDLGLVSAINLDGGGSTTTVINDTLRNYPSDQCVNSNNGNCARKVSTVLCVHIPSCSAPDCSHHGTCDLGRCQCQGHWTGKICDRLECPMDCAGHGTCTQDGCQCMPGWIGEDCSQPCPVGYYGQNCTLPCTCDNAATCLPGDGTCVCTSGFMGTYCRTACPFGYYGDGCKQVCFCKDSCYCDHITGNCSTAMVSRDADLDAAKCFARERIKKMDLVPAKTQQLWLCMSCVSIFAVITVASLLMNVTLTYFLTRERRTHKVESSRRASRAVQSALQKLRSLQDDTSAESDNSENYPRKSLLSDVSSDEETGCVQNKEHQPFLAPILLHGRRP